MLDVLAAGAISKFLMILKQVILPFHFPLGLANVVSPGKH